MKLGVAIEDTWDLTAIYPTASAWEEDAERIPALLAQATSHRGLLGESAARLRRALDDVMNLRQALERLRVYAMLRKDEDTASTEALARYERSVAIAVEVAEALAFFEPEILELPEEQFNTLRADDALTPYRHLLDNLARRRPHVRSIEIEPS